MFKIEGLDKLQRELDQASKALQEIDGELGVGRAQAWLTPPFLEFYRRLKST
jgi:hypothetical protein